MQPILVVVSSVPGLLYLGGRWVGELSPGETQTLPVSPRGAVYIEYHPLISGCLPLARRLTLANGVIVGASIADQSGLMAVQWPSGAIEIELSPERLPSPRQEARYLAAHGVAFTFARGDVCEITLARGDVRAVHALPGGAQPPNISLVGNKLLLTGACGEGQYLLSASVHDFAELLSITGDEIKVYENGAVRASRALDDAAGHSRTTFYPALADGYGEPEHELSAATRVPETPEEAALAAVSAMLLGLIPEAEGYFAPNQAHVLRAIEPELGAFSAAVPMKYAPGGRSSIGLLRVDGKNLLTVAPLYYTASGTALSGVALA